MEFTIINTHGHLPGILLDSHSILSSHNADDIALDWIGNNLYWTDAFYARIEVMDLDTRHRRELMRTGNNTIPRAIAVDPSTRY